MRRYQCHIVTFFIPVCTCFQLLYYCGDTVLGWRQWLLYCNRSRTTFTVSIWLYAYHSSVIILGYEEHIKSAQLL